jgi:Mg/Co/Ni transporter MgtE
MVILTVNEWYIFIIIRYVDPYAKIEIADYFDKFNKDILVAKAREQSVQEAIAEMSADIQKDCLAKIKTPPITRPEQVKDEKGKTYCYYSY